MMKKSVLFNTLFAAAVVSAVCTDFASADFVGMNFPKKHGSEGITLSDGTNLWVTNFVAKFDDPNDKVLSVGFANIRLFGAGTLWQDPLGSDTAPSSAFVGLFPDLAYDSFVTIGAKLDDDVTSLDPDFDSDAFAGDTVIGGWFASDPTAEQTFAGDDGEVLLLQYSIAGWTASSGFAGSMTIFWQDGSTGEVVSVQVSVFKPVPAPGALALLGCAGIGLHRRKRSV